MDCTKTISQTQKQIQRLALKRAKKTTKNKKQKVENSNKTSSLPTPLFLRNLNLFSMESLWCEHVSCSSHNIPLILFYFDFVFIFVFFIFFSHSFQSTRTHINDKIMHIAFNLILFAENMNHKHKHKQMLRKLLPCRPLSFLV